MNTPYNIKIICKIFIYIYLRGGGSLPWGPFLLSPTVLIPIDKLQQAKTGSRLRLLLFIAIWFSAQVWCHFYVLEDAINLPEYICRYWNTHQGIENPRAPHTHILTPHWDPGQATNVTSGQIKIFMNITSYYNPLN